MSGRLSALFDELEKRLGAAYGGRLTFGRGAKALDQNDAPPRVVWLYPQAGHAPAQKVRDENNRRPLERAILTRQVQVIAHCWGADLDATEQLVHDVIAATHGLAWGSVGFGGEQWQPSSNAELGEVALLTMSVDIPVMRRPLQAVTPTALALDITGAVPGDGVIEGNEP